MSAPAALLALVLGTGPLSAEPPFPYVAVRSWRDTVPTLPARDVGRFGRPGDPFNLILVGHEAVVRHAFLAAGWTEVPRTVLGSTAAGLSELLHGRRLAAFPPMNEYRLRARRQDMNWAIPVRAISERHHLRLWRTGDLDPDGRQVWAGTTNYDLRVRWRDLSHVPDPDIDRERDFVVESLRKTGIAARVDRVQLKGQEREGVNDKGYPYRTDGWTAVIELGR